MERNTQQFSQNIPLKVYKATYWFDIWVGMLSEGQKPLKCSGQSEEPARGWSP